MVTLVLMPRSLRRRVGPPIGLETYVFAALPRDRQKETIEALATDEWLVVEFGKLRERAFLRFAKSTSGEIVCSGLILGAERRDEVITARRVRAFPLAQILAHARFDDKASVRRWLELNLAGADALGPPIFRPGPKGHPREHYEQVAALYKRAVREAPDAPVKQVAKQLRTPEGNPTPEPTVRRWLQRCRQMKLLGPSRPGRPGRHSKRRKR